ncbi:MAG: hypothetical protein FWD94_01890 [Treponema sp.]|nr:hypothetical protein [Treponema sp.]
MRRICLIPFLLAATVGLHAERVSERLIPFRDAVYEQKLNADELKPLYTRTVASAREGLSGTALNLALSRAEFLMGKALLFEERNPEARSHFTEGLRLAELVLAEEPGAEGWVLRGENLAHLIQASNWTFAMANGLDVEKFARRALEHDPRNAAARYLIAARWVFAPRPFNNFKRGIQMMEEIVGQDNMDRDDLFNVRSAVGWALVQQREFEQARPWVRLALEVYPSNRFAAELMSAIEADRGGRGR